MKYMKYIGYMLIPTLIMITGCTSVLKGNIVTGKVAGGGVSIVSAPSPGLQAGYIQSALASVPVVDSKGNVIANDDLCGVKSPLNVYAIQNGNASANVAATSGGASAIAVNEATITGRAAELTALGGGQAVSAPVLAADKDCSKVSTASVLGK